MVICLLTLILPNIIAMINKTKLKARTLAIRAFLFLLHAAIIKMKETSCSKKSIVIITKKSDHSRVTSMSSLKKVGGIAENSLGKSVHRFIICNDGMSAHFRSGFMFKLLASTLFLEKEISWFYNEKFRPDRRPDPGRLYENCRKICSVNYNRISTKGSWYYRAERYR